MCVLVFVNRAAGVSLVVMVVGAILGTIQEVICRRAGDGEHRATERGLTHRGPQPRHRRGKDAPNAAEEDKEDTVFEGVK